MLKIIRYTAIAEGCSFLSFLITMPLKYGFQITTPNYIVGQVHGLLFLAFCVLVILGASEFKWKLKRSLILIASALVPGGTFWAEKRYLRESTVSNNSKI